MRMIDTGVRELWITYYDGKEGRKKAVAMELEAFLRYSPETAIIGVDAGNAVILLSGHDLAGHLYAFLSKRWVLNDR